MKKKVLKIELEGLEGKTPQKGVDYFTVEEVQQITDDIMSRIRVPEDGAPGKDAEPVDYLKIEKFVKKEVSKIPKPKEETPIDIDSIAKIVISYLPKQKKIKVDYEKIKEYCLEEIKKIEDNRDSRWRQLNSGGPTTRLGELVDVNLDGLQTNYILTWNGSEWVAKEPSEVDSEFDYIQFNTTAAPQPNAEGLLQWNATDGTLDLGMSGGDITQQIGQELFIKVRNASGSTIPNGTPVYFNGRQGNRPKIYPAKGDAEATSMVEGITTQDIPNNSDGFITTFGYVRQIKTNYAGWAEGNKLWVSKTTAGALTNEEPEVPHHSDVIGEVSIVGSAGIGAIFVRIGRHRTLQELSDVNGTAPTEGSFLRYNASAGYHDFIGNADLGAYGLSLSFLKDTNGTGLPIRNYNNEDVALLGKDGNLYSEFYDTVSIVGNYETLTIGNIQNAYTTVLGRTVVADVSNFYASLDTGSFTSDIDFYIWGYKIAPDYNYVYSLAYGFASVSDTNPFSVALNWDADDSEGYVIMAFDYGISQYYYIDIGLNTSFIVNDYNGWTNGFFSPGIQSPYDLPGFTSTAIYFEIYANYEITSDRLGTVKVTSANPITPYAEDLSGYPFWVRLEWDAVENATSYYIVDTTNGYYVEVSDTTPVIVDSSYSGWASGSPVIQHSSPYNACYNFFDALNDDGKYFIVKGTGDIETTGGIKIGSRQDAQNPDYSFIGDQTTGFYNPSNGVVSFSSSGNLIYTSNANGITMDSNSGIFKSGAGSASNPAFGFTGDLNTGMYLIGSDTLGFSTAGVERFRASSGGLFGIKTTNPITYLHVQGASSLATATTDFVQYWERPFNSGVAFARFAGIKLGSANATANSAGKMDFVVNAINSSIGANPSSVSLFTVMSLTGDGDVSVSKSVGSDVTLGNKMNILAYDNSTRALGVGGGIAFYGNFTGFTPTMAGAIKAYKSNATDNNWDFDMVFSTRLNGTSQLTERARLTAGGLLGVGTTAPLTMIHARLSNADNGVVSNVITMEHITSGTAGAGFGSGISSILEAGDGVPYSAGSIQNYWVDAGTAKTSEWAILTRAGKQFKINDQNASFNPSGVSSNYSVFVTSASTSGYISSGGYDTYEFGLYSGAGDETIASYDQDASQYYYFNRVFFGDSSGIYSNAGLFITNTGSSQFGVAYDGSNFLQLGVSSVGLITFNATGTTPEFLFNSLVRHTGAYAEIYVADGSTAQSIPTGTTYTKLTAFTTNGSSANCTADATNDKITITKAGKYLVNCVVSGYDGAAGAEFKMALFKAGVEQSNIHATNKFNAGSEIDNMEMCGIIVATANQDIDVRLRHGDAGSVNFTTQYANLTITYIGE